MSRNEEERSCALCEYAQEIHDEEHVLCDKKGVVARHYVCRKFSLDLFKLSPTPNAAPLFDPEHSFHDIL